MSNNTSVSIVSAKSGKDSDGYEFIKYRIRINNDKGKEQDVAVDDLKGVDIDASPDQGLRLIVGKNVIGACRKQLRQVRQAIKNDLDERPGGFLSEGLMYKIQEKQCVGGKPLVEMFERCESSSDNADKLLPFSGTCHSASTTRIVTFWDIHFHPEMTCMLLARPNSKRPYKKIPTQEEYSEDDLSRLIKIKVHLKEVVIRPEQLKVKYIYMITRMLFRTEEETSAKKNIIVEYK